MKKELLTAHLPFLRGKDGETELPVMYYADQTAMAFFTADTEAVKNMLPSDQLHPIPLGKNRCAVGFAVLNYLHSSVGSYGEFIFGIPALFDKKPLGPLPLLVQSLDPAFGFFVAHCPVTSQAAMIAGRNEWNVPKFMADMAFTVGTKGMECRLSSDGQKILDITVPKKGLVMREKRPLIIFEVQNGRLLRFPVYTENITELAPMPRDARLTVYPGHPMADDWLRVKPSKKPILTMWLNGRMAAMQKGAVLETGVRDWDGHRFENGGKDGVHTVTYGANTFLLQNHGKPGTDMQTTLMKD